MMKKLSTLSGKIFLDKELTELELEVVAKRFIQATVTTAAILLPLSAVAVPNQHKHLKLSEFFLGSSMGFLSALIASGREEIEERYESMLKLNREINKSEVANRFAKESFMLDIARDLSSAKELILNIPIPAALEYAERMNLPVGFFSGLLPDPPTPDSSLIEVKLKQIGIAEPNKDIVDLHVDKKPAAVIKAMAESYPDYIKIDGKWLLDLIESSANPDMTKRANHHFMIIAETQAGKSTLAGVIAKGIAQHSETPAVIACHDAKKKSGGKDITRWICDFTPHYKIDGYENSGVWAALMECLGVEQLELVSESGGGCKGVRELVLIQDEHNTVFGKGNGYGKHISPELAKELQAQWLFITTNLAGCKGHGIFMGQSPLAGDTGFSVPAMNNTCFIAMGETSGYILDGKNKSNYLRNISDDVMKLLQQACELFQKQGLRYALVRPTRGNPYIALIPEIDVTGEKRLISEQLYPTEVPIITELEVADEEKQKEKKSDKPGSGRRDDDASFSLSDDHKAKSNIQDVFIAIKEWYFSSIEKGYIPDSEDIKKLWFKECGIHLSDMGAEYIMQKIMDKDID